MLRSVSWGVQHVNLNVPQVENPALIHWQKIIPSTGASVKNVLRSSPFGKLPPTGNVVRMNVSVDNIADCHTTGFGGSEVKFRIIDGVAHGGQAFTTSTEYVRSGNNRPCVQQLTENHWALLSIDLRPRSIPLAKGSPCARQSWTLASRRNAVRPRDRSNRTASTAKTQYGPRQ